MRLSLAYVMALTLVATACGRNQEEKGATPAQEATPARTPATPARPAPIDGGLKEHMRGHFESIRSIERAIVAGDMQTAKTKAEALASHQSAPEVESYSEELEEVRKSASAIASSSDLQVMAQSAATLASQCGHCHLITSSITSFEWTEAPASDATGPDRMQRHRWAMDRLWEGLVGPSQHSWVAGAAILEADPIAAEALALHGMSKADAQAKLQALQALGSKASAATELAERTAVYGALLGTCSACHATTKASP